MIDTANQSLTDLLLEIEELQMYAKINNAVRNVFRFMAGQL